MLHVIKWRFPGIYRVGNSPEVVAETTALLKGLREHLVLLDVVVGHRPARWCASIAAQNNPSTETISTHSSKSRWPRPTNLLANFMASSKCALVISGTRSSSSSTSMVVAPCDMHFSKENAKTWNRQTEMFSQVLYGSFLSNLFVMVSTALEITPIPTSTIFKEFWAQVSKQCPT